MACGACARIGTNDTRPMAHSPDCSKGKIMVNAKGLGFGYRIETIKAPALWGARAIFTGGTVDLLPDRQDWLGEPADRATLRTALNDGALDLFRDEMWRRVCAGRYSTDHGGHVTIHFKGVVFDASTNGSCGYLYVTARLEG